MDLDDRVRLKTRIGHYRLPKAAGVAHAGDATWRLAHHLIDREITAKIAGADTLAGVAAGGCGGRHETQNNDESQPDQNSISRRHLSSLASQTFVRSKSLVGIGGRFAKDEIDKGRTLDRPPGHRSMALLREAAARSETLWGGLRWGCRRFSRQEEPPRSGIPGARSSAGNMGGKPAALARSFKSMARFSRELATCR